VTSGDYIADFGPRVELEPAATALVLIDFQRALASRVDGLGRLLAAEGRLHEAAYRFERITHVAVPNASRLLAMWREHDLPRAFVTVGSSVSDYSDLPPHLRELCRATNNRAGEREHELLAPLHPRPDECVLNKRTLSPFASTPLALLLRNWGVDTVIFAGITTNMCVEHALRDAADRGFGCVLVEDACAADTLEMHEATLRVVRRLYGRVATAEALLEEVSAACMTS
jgi:nicotinamidase-related amidase